MSELLLAARRMRRQPGFTASVIAAAASALIPARRATAVSPQQALRG